MRRISLLRRGVALPVLAALVTSAVVAAVSLAGQTASPNGNATGNGQILGQPVGQLVLETGGTPIPIFSYSWGASNPTSFGLGGGGIGAGKVSFSSFNLMKQIDSSSAGLFTAVARGTIFPKDHGHDAMGNRPGDRDVEVRLRERDDRERPGQW